MRDIVVDTNVLMKASGTSQRPALPCHIDLLDLVRSSPDIQLALDAEGFVNHEYAKKMKADTLAIVWLKEMLSRDKVKIIPCATIDKKHKNKFERNIHPEDRRFVKLAAATVCKHLVSEDGDFNDAVKGWLRKAITVVVRETQEACDLIRANQDCNQPLPSPGSDDGDNL